MPPVRITRRPVHGEECPIPGCVSGRLQTITKAGQHFSTKNHQDLCRSLKESDEAAYRDIFLAWARKMKYISVIGGIPSRTPMRTLDLNSQAVISETKGLKKSSSASLSQSAHGTNTFKAQRTKSTPLVPSRNRTDLQILNSSPPAVRITWLPPVVVNPVRRVSQSVSQLSTSPMVSESTEDQQEENVIVQPTETFDSPLQPSLESFYYYDFTKGPATIYHGATYFWSNGVPASIPPPALLPPSLIPPIPTSQNHSVPGYIFTPNTHQPVTYLEVPHTPVPMSHLQVDSHARSAMHHSSDDTVIDEEAIEQLGDTYTPPMQRQMNRSGSMYQSQSQGPYSEDNTLGSPSTVSDEQQDDLLRSFMDDNPVLASYQGSAVSLSTSHTSPEIDPSLYINSGLRSNLFDLQPDLNHTRPPPMMLFTTTQSSSPLNPIVVRPMDASHALPPAITPSHTSIRHGHCLGSDDDYDYDPDTPQRMKRNFSGPV
ncbi:hypothetical protein V1512DRAFT_256105 [Lipomyces arxii]|uniref:uncharacterized protein n=1 Tax=Lipomyces arxii TaxID=56418 RepID=UPI0034CE01CD